MCKDKDVQRQERREKLKVQICHERHTVIILGDESEEERRVIGKFRWRNEEKVKDIVWKKTLESAGSVVKKKHNREHWTYFSKIDYR